VRASPRANEADLLDFTVEPSNKPKGNEPMCQWARNNPEEMERIARLPQNQQVNALRDSAISAYDEGQLPDEDDPDDDSGDWTDRETDAERNT
jgi:hypothetical protein